MDHVIIFAGIKYYIYNCFSHHATFKTKTFFIPNCLEYDHPNGYYYFGSKSFFEILDSGHTWHMTG